MGFLTLFCTAGEPEHSPLSLFLHERVLVFSFSKLCCLGGSCDVGKVSLTHSNVFKLFASVEFWNFSSRDLDFYNGPCAHQYMPKSVFSRYHSQEGLETGHRILPVLQLLQGFAYYLVYRWVRLLSVFCHMTWIP